MPWRCTEASWPWSGVPPGRGRVLDFRVQGFGGFRFFFLRGLGVLGVQGFRAWGLKVFEFRVLGLWGLRRVLGFGSLRFYRFWVSDV